MKNAFVVCAPQDVITLGRHVMQLSIEAGWTGKEAADIARFIAETAKDTIVNACQNQQFPSVLVSLDMTSSEAAVEFIHEGVAMQDLPPSALNLTRLKEKALESLHGSHTQILRMRCARDMSTPASA